MKVLVTGGAGFIGSHVAEAAVEAGCEVLDAKVKDPARLVSSLGEPTPLWQGLSATADWFQGQVGIP